jgi:hypothetical protein
VLRNHGKEGGVIHVTAEDGIGITVAKGSHLAVERQTGHEEFSEWNTLSPQREMSVILWMEKLEALVVSFPY